MLEQHINARTRKILRVVYCSVLFTHKLYYSTYLYLDFANPIYRYNAVASPVLRLDRKYFIYF